MSMALVCTFVEIFQGLLMHILYVSFVQETLSLGHPLFLGLFSRRRIVSLLLTHGWVSGLSKGKA